MPRNSEILALRLEQLICDPARLDQPESSKLILEAIEAGDADLFQLIGEAVITFPDTAFLPPLWALVKNDRLEEALRAAAFTGIAAMLVASVEDADDPLLQLIELELELLSAEQIEEQVSELLRVYRSAGFPSAVRRRALETAANISGHEAIRAAGFAALNSDDPEWTVTGVLVISLTDGPDAREHIERALRHDTLDVRLEAIHALAGFGTDDDFAVLEKLIRRGGEEARVTLLALSDVPNERAGEILFQATEICPAELEEDADEAYELWLDSWAGFEAELHESIDIGDEE